MRYEFRYRPHNAAGEAYYDLPVSVDVEPNDGTYAIRELKLNDVVVDDDAHFTLIDDYIGVHHAAAIDNALHEACVPHATARHRTMR